MSPALVYDFLMGNRIFWYVKQGLERYLHKLATHSLPLSEVTRTVELLTVSFFADRKATISGVCTGLGWFVAESFAFRTLATQIADNGSFQRGGIGQSSLIPEILRVRRACFLDPILEEAQNALVRWVVIHALSFARQKFPAGLRLRNISIVEFRAQTVAVFGVEITETKIAIFISTLTFILNHHHCKNLRWMMVVFPGSLHYAFVGASHGVLAPTIAHIVHNTCCEIVKSMNTKSLY